MRLTGGTCFGAIATMALLNLAFFGVDAFRDGQGTIKARIKTLIEAETARNILSDQQLAEMLQEEGFDLARRTVAKYREAIGLGSSAERRRAKKLAGLR